MRLPLLLSWLCLAALAGAPAATAAGPAGTRASLERSIRAAGSASSVMAVDLDTGATIASVRAAERRIPASVEKLFTTATALLRFGPEGRLTTSVLAAQAPDEEGTVTDVWLRGGGDPTLDAAGLKALAEGVADAGVVRVTGDVFADESAFDTLRGPPSEGYRASGDIAPLSALAFQRTWRPVTRIAVLFRQALRRARVKVAGDARAAAGRAPEEPAVLAELESPPMSELARRTNVPSDNWYAELLLKGLGARFGAAGSTSAGAAVITEAMHRFGISPRIADGSGLSRANVTTAAQVTRLLVKLDTGELAEPFFGSLAVAGRTGTLHDRMRGTPAQDRCRGKTGTIRGVSNLAGYCTTRSGSRVAFAILMNQVNVYGARRLQNRMLSALARYEP
jgi:D-alanyl-D-alanine carboxypeptidase/D-alanyl-D-alanine-endopeptidase (penicillin-binding protein 4)